MSQNKVLSLIGLATRAGKTASGEFQTEKSIKTGRAYVTVIAEDASENTRKKFRNMCHFYQVPVYILGEKESLGKAMGKSERSSMAVLDENFASAILKELRQCGKEMEVVKCQK